MGILELMLLSIGLSMDAFAVSVSKGLKMKKFNYIEAITISLFFGIFQAFMPLIGWILGTEFGSHITNVDHWIAFVLLSTVGGKMIYDSIHCENDKDNCALSDKLMCAPLDIKELFVLSIATSIDALAVGITFALLPSINIWISIASIGVITFLFSFIGVIIGSKFGNRLEKHAGLLGGLLLIGIGLKILIEHLFLT